MRRPLALTLVPILLLASAPSLHAEPAAPAPTPARAARAPVPLDGVAAIVDDTTIFRSDVTSRARPFEAKLSRDPVKRRGELIELTRQLVLKMIDEVLVAKDAQKLHLDVTDAEIDAAITAVAQQNKIDKKTLDAELDKAGFTQLAYREELKRQIIDQKWLMTRAAGKIDRKKAADAASFQIAVEKQRESLLVELRSHSYIEVR
jgi:peptidyl-prolyl cis-trans isomerase SurA